MGYVNDGGSGMKAKVVISFILAIVTFVVLGGLAYRSFDKLLEAIHQITEPNDKLRSMNAIIIHLSEAESSSRAYSISKKRKYYDRYKQEVEEVNAHIGNLVSGDWQGRVEKEKLDSIFVLLNEKIQRLQRFLRSRSGNKVSYTEKALAQIDENGMDSTTLTTFSRRKSTTTSSVDTVLVYKPVQDIEQVKGIFNKIKKLLSKKEPITGQVDTMTRIMHETQYEFDTSEVFQPDTLLISEVKKILEEIRQEEYDHHTRDMVREMQLLEANSSIINQIKTVIKDLEDSESKYYTRQKEQARVIVRDHLTVIVMIIILAFLGCFICILLIFGDISKSNFYRSRLEKAKIRAEKLARAREQFLANVSHELKTPLNAILGFSEQLSKTDAPADQHSYISIIHNSSNHLLALVNDILDMSKVAADGFELVRTPFHLNEIMDETYLTFLQRAEQKGIVLIKRKGQYTNDFLAGDVLRFKQVLFNIMDNAIKFTDRGEVILEMYSKAKKHGRVEVVVHVRDSGVGIPKEQLDRVFDNFYQGDSTMTKKHLGTGLGLAISHKLVRAMGGEIQVESEPEVGTCFTIKMPFDRVEESEMVIPVERAVDYELLKSTRLLVIDDDRFNTILLQTILTNKVSVLTCVHDAKEALYKLGAYTYDMVLTDIHMPDINGMQFLEKLREGSSVNSSIPVIAVTADSSRSRGSWLSSYGFNDLIYKPFNEQMLLATLSASLKNVEAPVIKGEPEKRGLSVETLLVFAGGDMRTVAVLLEVFRDNALKDLKYLKRFHAMGDFSRVKKQAHKMISPFAQIRLSKTVDLLRSIEKEEDMPPQHVFSRLFESIDQALLQVEEKMEELQASHNGNISSVNIK